MIKKLRIIKKVVIIVESCPLLGIVTRVLFVNALITTSVTDALQNGKIWDIDTADFSEYQEDLARCPRFRNVVRTC